MLKLCSLFGVLIADGERVYDPRAYHDRLLLGLSGIMNDAELHQIKLRLHQGERQETRPFGMRQGGARRVFLKLDKAARHAGEAHLVELVEGGMH